MDARQKFLGTMGFDTNVAPPLWEMGCWAGTLRRWYREGLQHVDGIDEQWEMGDGVSISFSLSRRRCRDPIRAANLDGWTERLLIENGLFPQFEPEVLEETTEHTVLIDEMGIKKRISKAHDSIPEFFSWPVKTRSDWERLKEQRLDPKTPGRYPENLDAVLAAHRERDYPLSIGSNPVGFFGSVRWLMGEIRLLTGYYDDPDLIKDIIDYMCDFWIELWDPVLSKIKVDYVLLWEDMCYKTGPLISPDLFRRFMLPAYRRFTAFLRDWGVENIIVDTDGNFWQLIPLFMKGGVTGLFPCEVAAGMDVVELRQAFPKLQLLGGIDKRVLAGSRQAIDDELEARIPALLKLGGFIPHVDHHIPPEVPWENFLYYRRRLAETVDQIWPAG